MDRSLPCRSVAQRRGLRYADYQTKGRQVVNQISQIPPSSRGCTCPRCWLTPQQVAEGDHWPIPYGPELVLCPKCGLVPHSGPVAPPETYQALKEGRQARAAFHASTRRKGRSSNDPVGKAKPLPSFRKLDLYRPEQGPVGFPEVPSSSRPRAIEPLEEQVAPYLTNEILEWLRGMAARASGTDSDVVRICLSWAWEFRPALRKFRPLSSSKKRHRLNVRLKSSELVALEQLAADCALVPPRYLVCLLEELRRKSTQPKAFLRRLRGEG